MFVEILLAGMLKMKPENPLKMRLVGGWQNA